MAYHEASQIDTHESEDGEGSEAEPNANEVPLLDNLVTSDQGPQTPIIDAAKIFLLLPQNVPVSRSARFRWFLEHLNTTIKLPSNYSVNNLAEDVEIISIVPYLEPKTILTEYLITPNTEVIFLAQTYRFVYCLDMSPSQSAVDVDRNQILFDEILNCFKTSLLGLCRQFTIPCCSVKFQPSLYLTVIVNTPFFISPAQQVIVKGVQVSSHNVQDIINLVQTQFYHLEGRIADVSARAYMEIDQRMMENEAMVGGLFDLAETDCIANIPMVSPDSNFVNMLRYSMLATSLLPENSLSHILVVTDGVVSMPHSNILESLLYQLHYDDIAVSFLKVGSSFKPNTSAGYVPYTDLLEFLSDSTMGTLLEEFPIVKPEPTLAMNLYQQLYLLWSFNCNFKSKINQKKASHNECYYNLIHRIPTLLVKRQNEQNLNSTLTLLISRRMREGYVVKDVKYVKNVLKVKLCLQWKTHIYIFYELTSTWPSAKNLTHVEINISAPYDFLHDITCMMKKETKSTFRQAVFERFWMRITQLSSNDNVLAQQLSAFRYTNVWSMLPESVRNGIPVFTTNGLLPCDGSANTVITPSDSSSPKFTQMWQPLCYLDTNSWRKWFHLHKVSLILKHDHPLPKFMHLSNPSGRFQIIQCRQAATALFRLLSDWSSFVVVDNHTYVKLLHRDEDKPAISFCVIRLTSKLPCATINLGFMTGTPGYTRHKAIEELKTQLRSLSYLSTPLKAKDNICCTLLMKPLEKILIRYERIPTDFHTVIFPDGTQNSLESLPPSPLAGTLFTTLSRYLFHQRWIWNAMHLAHLKLDMHSISRILSTLTKMRVQEGFNFAHSASGIITMVLELAMDSNSSCVIQYVIFPPHSVWWGDNSNSGSEDDSEIKGYSELQIVTEVWIEPQHGKVLPEYPRVSSMEGKHYYELADMIKLADMRCIHSLLTVEHLSLLAQEKHPQYTNSSVSSKTRKKYLRRRDNFNNGSSVPLMNSEINATFWNPTLVERIQHIPFDFDPISILFLCQQTELLFSMFIEEKNREVIPPISSRGKSNLLLLDNIHKHLLWINDHELSLDYTDSLQYTKQILQRYRYKASHSCPLRESLEWPSKKPLWRCFVKGISMTHVILTMIPASLEALKHLTAAPLNVEDFESDYVSEPHFRTSSQNSNYSEVPINVKQSMTLPIYIYDCPLGVLVDSYIKSQDTKKADVYEDHRHEHAQYFEPDSINLKAGDESSISPEPKSEDSETNEIRNSAKQHCRAITLTHSKCFAVSLFAALQCNSYIDNADVRAALNECEEIPFEIDISRYLKTVCGHLKYNESNIIASHRLNQRAPCCELRQLHQLIKDKFSSLSRTAFAATPTDLEYYYCKNLYEAYSVKAVDSDDEISLPLNIKLESHARDETGSAKETEKLAKPVSPLFLRFVCTLHYNDRVNNVSVRLLPTCLGELIDNNDIDDEICIDKLKINLGILCLTLPVEVQNVINDYSTKELRHTSFCSDGFPPSCSSVSEASLNSEFKDCEPLSYLPEDQKDAIYSLRNEIEWLLKDEIAAALLDIEPVSQNTLNFVMNHVADSDSRRSCILERIDLRFVYSATESYEKFVKEFSSLSIPQYILEKEGDLYYLAKNREEFKVVDHNVIVEEPEYVTSLWKNDVDQKFEEHSQSDISSINGSIVGTDAGYDEDVSENEEDYNWLLELNEKRSKLPNFWLITRVEENFVTVYFHCRFLELPTIHVAIYLEFQRAVIEEIRNLCKRVNQALLLQSLHDTRACDPLLEPVADNIRNMEEMNDDCESYTPLPIESLSGFKPGYFSCPIVWNIPFTLHPRLKTGPGKSFAFSMGISALKTVLDKFSVTNRDNMFVYKDCNSNVFYLRLQENGPNSCSRGFQLKTSEFDQQPVTRSPSIASLPVGQKNNLTRSDFSISSTTSSEIRPRVRSFGEKDTKDGYCEDSVTLRVYGISEAGDDIRFELYQVLQNRLDDVVLEVLSVMLSRNAMCPLTPEDVHFLQKPFKAPEQIIKLSIQEQSLKMIDSFILYLKQNLLQFLNLPKYTDRSHSRFKDYTESDQINKVLDDNIFIYNQSQNPSSGSKGIACIALAIIDSASNTTSGELDLYLPELIRSGAYQKIVDSNMLNEEDCLPPTYLEFRIWKQGRINSEMLHEKLCAATSHATWDIITEYSLLKYPLCAEISNLKLQPYRVDKKKRPFGEIKFFFNLDTQLNKADISEIMKKHEIKYENFANRRRTKRMIPHNSIAHRAILFDNEQQQHSAHKRRVSVEPVESGDVGHLMPVYTKETISKWFEFAIESNTPALRKIKISLLHCHPIYCTIRELQHVVASFGNDSVRVFKDDILSNTFVPYTPSHSVQNAIIICRNFEQWKFSLQLNGASEYPDNIPLKSLKHTQKFLPGFINDKYISRQKLLWALVGSKAIYIYVYNWSKDNVMKLREQCQNLESWLNVRASVLSSGCAQKMGLFHNQAMDRKLTLNASNPYFNCIGDVEAMIKYPKERSKKANSTDSIPLEIFRDNYKIIKDDCIDPIVGFTVEMFEIKKMDKKHREELKKLYAMYQSRTNSSTHNQIQILLQNSRVIHYCHTPLLFLPRWRLESAATRDHSILNPSHYGLNETILDNWHESLLQGFASEYKRYLQSLGFLFLEVDSSKKLTPVKKAAANVSFMQKAILGGILLFTLELSEPFFITKLYSIECNRIPSSNSRASINQFTQSFLDECDKIKIYMHLHSFTYDFHLRSIFNYISNNSGYKVCQDYHLINFLDDFVKYYNKAPNYARNLVHADSMVIDNLITEGSQLYTYLLSNVKQYNLNVVSMLDEVTSTIEYVLVQVSSISGVSYKDSQDRQHTDDFDITIIISNICPADTKDQTLHLKYYLILTSRRKIYPKADVERKLGKFRTVSSTSKSFHSDEFKLSKGDEDEEDEELDAERSHDKKSDSDKSLILPMYQSTDEESAEESRTIKRRASHVQIKQESVNYLGYYSSHEQLMQQLILNCAEDTQKTIREMVTQGMVHCRTHLLWNKLLSQTDNNQLTYDEFNELKNLAKLENLCDVHANLSSLINQPFNWYQGLVKILLNKYHDQYRAYESEDGNIHHYAILHPRYVGAFMLLSIDMHISRGELFAVYRTSQISQENDICSEDRKTLLDGFINCICYYLWSGMI